MSGRSGQPPRHWYEGGRVPLHAQALSGLYAVASGLRRGLYQRRLLRARKAGRPVVVVGNLVAGGSGKTPLTIALVERLRAAGWTPGVASRGYGRADASTPRWVDAGTDPALGGDEPVLIAARTGARVRVDRDRVAAARALVAEGCDVVVCDDGLQHYRLARDLEIEVIDGRRRYGNGRLLPAGPLREPPARASACDFRVLNVGTDAELAADFGEWPMWLEPGRAGAAGGGPTAPSRCPRSPASACTPWPASAIRSASSPCCAGRGSPWFRTPSATTTATPPRTCASAATCRCC
ncbi:lipid-A-disaccharide kinase [Luteimonas sp. J16]|nr:lipid-A-disaccharide kinase [Luteimonas sp. J16]